MTEMKHSARRIIMLLVTQACFVTNVSAQDDIRALGAAADTIIRHYELYPAYIVEPFLEEVCNKLNNNADLCVRIARAYSRYEKDDTTKVMKYLRRAIATNPQYAPAYVLAGDFLSEKGRGKEAMEWLERGISQNPTDSSLYIASAMLLAYTDTEAAVAKVMALKEKDPNFPVELQVARLYTKMYSENRVAYLAYDEVVTYYGKVYDGNLRSQMNLGDYGYYCMGLQFADAKKFPDKMAKLYDVSSYALTLFADDYGLRRFNFISAWGTQKWAEGIKAFQKTKEADKENRLEAVDYVWYGQCLVGAERYDEGIEQLEKAIKMPGISETNIVVANNTIASAVTGKANNLLKAKDYAGAISIMQPYVDKDRTKSKQNDKLILSYADFYRIWGNNLEGAEQDEKWKKADEQFLEGMKRSVLNKAIFAKRRYDIAVLYDRTATTGAAVPVVNEVVEVLEKEALNDPNVKGALFEPYRYLRAYYTNTNKYALAVEYAEKILDIVPDDQASLQVITAFSKAVKRK